LVKGFGSCGACRASKTPRGTKPFNPFWAWCATPYPKTEWPWGEYARDEDGDGFCEVHVNTMEGFWSLLRSWLRPHRGISQEKLPLYLGFFEFVHNVRKRGKALLGSLIELLVSKDPGIQ
jgi:hypothetical protein